MFDTIAFLAVKCMSQKGRCKMNFESLWISLSIIMILIIFRKACYVIPNRTVFIIERLGKYNRTIGAGFHILIPFIDRVAYRHSLKEKAIDTPKQICITKDNISVEVDGILYLQVMDPKSASYGINDYLFATIQIAQTTMRSIVGKMDLDDTFKKREFINEQIVKEADVASDPWGIKVNRYEIKDIKPPKTINDAMEKQMRAEREKRAVIAQSEGEKQARINKADGEKQELIAKSEGEKTKRINEAQGKAEEIREISLATSEGLKKIALSIKEEGGKEAVSLRVAEQYVKEFGHLAKTNNTMIIPSNLSDVASIVATATTMYKKTTGDKKELLRDLSTAMDKAKRKSKK